MKMVFQPCMQAYKMKILMLYNSGVLGSRRGRSAGLSVFRLTSKECYTMLLHVMYQMYLDGYSP